jgi:heme-degrading monooxygenase HmoA
MIQTIHEKSWKPLFAIAFVVFAAAVAAFAFARTLPDAAAAPTQVVAVVQTPIPAALDRTRLEGAMFKTVPFYQKVPDLVRKYFIISPDNQKFGGIYLWDSRAAAEAWYSDSPVWHAGVSKTTGSQADIAYFDVPIVTDGPESQNATVAQSAADAAASTLVAAVVTIPIPAGVDRAKLEQAMANMAPESQTIPGLIRKYSTISDDQKFGGIYLWASREAAEARYNDDWRAKMVKSYGAQPEITYFDVPIAIQGPAPQR